jgi:carbonic anhydrase
MVNAIAARMDFGANFVRTLAAKAVTIQHVDKAMDIAVLAKANIGETFVTRHAAKVVHQIVLKVMENVAVALPGTGVYFVIILATKVVLP